MLSDVISLKQVVGSLEPNDRKLIVLRYFSGMTQVQTAARLGMTQAGLPPRKKILTALRRELTGQRGEGNGRASDRRDMRKRRAD
ncbi:MAG: sigma factor-like helix-turn-helix DNA-binding protein [Anaerotruncus massiliensis (ex Togo et al. 2019)]